MNERPKLERLIMAANVWMWVVAAAEALTAGRPPQSLTVAAAFS